MGCEHDIVEVRTAVDCDGLCPLCLLAENKKFRIALRDISDNEDSRKARGVGYDITIDIIAKIALGNI